jgi:hypothetical protein
MLGGERIGKDRHRDGNQLKNALCFSVLNRYNAPTTLTGTTCSDFLALNNSAYKIHPDINFFFESLTIFPVSHGHRN